METLDAVFPLRGVKPPAVSGILSAATLPFNKHPENGRLLGVVGTQKRPNWRDSLPQNAQRAIYSITNVPAAGRGTSQGMFRPIAFLPVLESCHPLNFGSVASKKNGQSKPACAF